jgi:atypical dual specificity phosphatase
LAVLVLNILAKIPIRTNGNAEPNEIRGLIVQLRCNVNPKSVTKIAVSNLKCLSHCNRMSQITPQIVLGSLENASSDLFFRAWKITHILNCAVEHGSFQYPNQLPTIYVPLEDDEYPAAESLILNAAGALEEWTKKGHVVFVHCKAGVSRSPTIVMAWLMVYKNYSFDDAWTSVVKARPYARPNSGFVKILKSLSDVL